MSPIMARSAGICLAVLLILMAAAGPASSACTLSVIKSGTVSDASGIFVLNDVAYIASSASSGYLITVPLSTMNIEHNWGLSHPAIDVFVSGNIAYLTEGSAGVEVVDAATGQKLGKCTNWDPNHIGLDAYGIYISGSYAYVGAIDNSGNNNGYLVVLSLQDPTSPSYVRAINVGSPYAGGLCVTDGKIYLATDPKVYVYTTSSPDNPAFFGQLDISGAYDVHVFGNRIYIVAPSSSPSVEVRDLSNPATLIDCYGAVYPYAIQFYGGKIYIVGSGDGLKELGLGTGTLTVSLDANDQAGQTFSFLSPNSDLNFDLDDDSATAILNYKTFNYMTAGDYVFHQIVPSEWLLKSITDSASSSVSYSADGSTWHSDFAAGDTWIKASVAASSSLTITFQDTKGSSISGTKFNDLDGDGIKDAGENGLAGWKIYCDNNNDGSFQDGETYAITDANGDYTLANLLPGTYNVREVLKTAWTQTTPTGNLHTVVLADVNADGRIFGNRGALSISGTKFNDLDGDGIKDAGENGLADWKIYCDNNNDGSFQDGETYAITDANGAYTLANLVPGTYNVREVLKTGWAQTTPTGNLYTVVLTDVNAVDKHFGNLGALSISGTKFYDLDGDGTKDAGESGLADWKIYCDNNNDGSFQDGEISDITDANGDYTLANLGPGTYNVREVLKTGWTQTTPAANLHTVVLTDANAVDKSFGNRGTLSISGTKFHDLDGDSTKDAEESGLADWKIYCDNNNDGNFQDGEISAITDVNGDYTLAYLGPGTYNVREVLKTGWTQTTPAANLYAVVLTDANAVDKSFGNRGGLSISGTKFHDLDGDGIKDAGENGLADWKIYCDNNNDGSFQDGEISAITDANGAYTLANLVPGTYNVREVLKTGWTQTTPAAKLHTVELTDANAVDKSFGNRGGLSISGTKFHDLDGDGIKDAGENGLADWKIYCDNNNDGSFQDGETYAITDANGDYTLANLVPGTYNVREVLKTGWTQTTPAANLYAVVLTDANAVDKSFGNRGGLSISGTKFHDLDGDGIKDAGENGLADWKIYCDNNNDGSFQDGETYAITDANGDYTLANLVPGTYNVREVLKTGWTQTTPAANLYAVVLTDANAVDKSFGNRGTLSISGTKFHDLDGDGTKDVGENGLADWKIYCDKNNDGSFQDGEIYAITDANGDYTLANLVPGTYNVREVLKTGWTQTTPAANLYAVVLTDANAVDKSFGNQGAISISGTKFHDLNGDGTKDAGESGLADWKIYCDNNNDGNFQDGEISAITDANGDYTLANLVPGTYNVREVLKTGWAQTTPSGNLYTVVLTDANVGDKSFGNRGGLSISGMKFHDKNANGQKDADEPALSGWDIELKDSSDNLLKTVTTSSDPGKEGIYEFSNLRPGSYRVYEVQKTGWVRTAPENEYYSIVLTDSHSRGNIFGNNQLAISGLKFHDKNADGQKDADEPALPSWEIKLKDNSDSLLKTTTTSAEPGKEGVYEFVDLQPGTYRVYEVQKTGWVRTAPEQEYHAVTLTNMPSRGNFFGNNQLAISGMKFHDQNANGQKEADEPPLSGWQIQLKDSSDNLLQTATTSSDPGKEGVYEFIDLQPGTYRVYEVQKTGWVRTAPEQEYHAVTLTNVPSRGNLFGNNLVKISGIKFEDLNGNGAKDAGEPGLAGWTIKLKKEGTEVDSTQTAAGGAYSFEGLAPGSYTVEETAQSGWTQSYPPSGTHAFSLASGDAGRSDLDFGNYRTTGFSGLKFEDLNGNGAKDSGEPGLAGWTIKLMKGDTVIASTQTASDGSYSFAGIAPGSYTVEEIAQSGWTQSYPSTGTYSVTLVSGVAGPNDIDFGNYWSTGLSGMKFEDLNGNAAKDSGEPGLQGWTIWLMKGDSEIASIVTAADGSYSFTDIVPGSYTVEEVLQSGWLQTYPAAPGTHSVTLFSGVTGPNDIDFGNWKTTGFSGMKLEDSNANGAKDSGEPGLSGWTIRLMNGATEVAKTVTAAEGSYSFTGVVPGSYTVEEEAKAGWTQSYPASGTHAITLASGVDGPKDVDFGNWRKTGLSGVKFEDINGNGAKDSGEPGLSGWTIKLMNGATEVAKTVTDADGGYSFADIVPGSYTVEEEAKADWLQTCPASPGIYSLNLLSGVDGPNDVDFGNFRAGGFAGLKFEDKNGNGVRDSGEPGLSGWTIVLKKDGAQVASTQTAADGAYFFADLAPGSYTVEETAQDGWTQTSPAGNVYTAVSSSGQVKITRADKSEVPATEANFGNRKLVEAFRVEIVADHRTVLPGESLVFTITINRVGDILLNSLSVQYTLPKGLKFVSANPSPQNIIENLDGSTTLIWTDLSFISQIAAQLASSQSVSASPTDPSAPSTTITVTSMVQSDAPPVLTGTVEVEGSTVEADVAKAEDTVTVNVPSQHIYLNKTSDLKEVWPGATIGYTIDYESLVDIPLTGVVITEQASSDLIFLSATPAPDLGTENVWSIGRLLPGEKGTIKVLFQVKNASNLSFESQSSVSGSGFVNSYRRLSTETQSGGLKNSVTLTCYQLPPVSTSYFVKLRDSEGTSLLKKEHGSGEYRNEEIAALQMQNRSISTEGSLKAVYRPTSFSLPGNKSIDYDSEISYLTRTRNRATQASTSQEFRYAKDLEMDQQLLLDKNETIMSIEAAVQGQAHLGVLKKDGALVKPSPVFESTQDYAGSFRFNQSLQDYGGNVRLIRNASGLGQAASDQRLKKSQRSYEHGSGSYESEELVSTAESYIARDLSVCYDPQYGYGKWRAGIWSRSPGQSYLGQEISGADYIREETKAGGLNDMSSNLSFKGKARLLAVSQINRSELDMDEEYVGQFSLQRRVHMGGVSRFDRPHLTLNKTGRLVPDTVAADYTITVLNDGNAALGPVYVWDIFPARTDYLSSSLKPDMLQPGYANWSLLYLGIGQSVNISLRLNVTDQREELVNVVYASGEHNGEWVTAGNMSVMQFGWLGCCQPEILVEKQARIDAVDSRLIWYRILLKNQANASLVAQVRDRLPAGLKILNASAQPQVDGLDLVWVTTAIPVGESRFIEYLAQAMQNGKFVNTARIEAHALDGSGGATASASATITVGEATSYAEDGWRPPEWGLDRSEVICDDEIAGEGASCSCPVEGI